MNTVLFDLDGTLLPLDMKKFMQLYFYQLSIYFKELIDGQRLASYIMNSTEAMINNLDPVTNEKVFMDDFSKRINYDIEIYKRKFDEFYDTAFMKVRECTFETPYMVKSVELLKQKGYSVAVATNPIFPLKAVHHRLVWAGFKPEDFIYISSYETNHYCKPYIEYYKEVLQAICKSPDECLMVGNDVQEDLAAGKLGVKTYLIKDCIINRVEGEIKTDYQGSYEDFYTFVLGLPELTA